MRKHCRWVQLFLPFRIQAINFKFFDLGHPFQGGAKRGLCERQWMRASKSMKRISNANFWYIFDKKSISISRSPRLVDLKVLSLSEIPLKSFEIIRTPHARIWRHFLVKEIGINAFVMMAITTHSMILYVMENVKTSTNAPQTLITVIIIVIT